MIYDEAERRLKQIQKEIEKIEKIEKEIIQIKPDYENVKNASVKVKSLMQELSNLHFQRPREYPNTHMYAVPYVEKEHNESCNEQIEKLIALENKIKQINFKINLSEPDYKYGKDKNRFHAFKTKTINDDYNPLLKDTKQLSGDKLKKQIVNNIKQYIEDSLNGKNGEKKSMNAIIDSIKTNPAYAQILAKGTGVMTRTFGLETSSKKAVDKMLDEAEEQENLRPKMK